MEEADDDPGEIGGEGPLFEDLSSGPLAILDRFDLDGKFDRVEKIRVERVHHAIWPDESPAKGHARRRIGIEPLARLLELHPPVLLRFANGPIPCPRVAGRCFESAI